MNFVVEVESIRFKRLSRILGFFVCFPLWQIGRDHHLWGFTSNSCGFIFQSNHIPLPEFYLSLPTYFTSGSKVVVPQQQGKGPQRFLLVLGWSYKVEELCLCYFKNFLPNTFVVTPLAELHSHSHTLLYSSVVCYVSISGNRKGKNGPLLIRISILLSWCPLQFHVNVFILYLGNSFNVWHSAFYSTNSCWMKINEWWCPFITINSSQLNECLFNICVFLALC